MKIQELKDLRHKLIMDCRALYDKVYQEEKREFTVEEDARYNQMMKDVGKHKIEIERVAALEEEEARMSHPTSTPEKPAPSGNAMNEKRNVYATDEYRKVFDNFLRGETDFRQIKTELRALQADSDVAGGYLTVPQLFFGELLRAVTSLVQIRSVGRVITLDRAESLGVPRLTNNMADADWTTELQTGSADTTLDFGKREIRPHPLAKKILVSKKLLTQAAISAEQVVRDELSRVVGEAEENAFMTGSGSGRPLGLFTVSSDGIPATRDVSTGNTTTTITFDGLKTAKGTLKRQYRNARTRWVFHRDAITQISKLKDGEGRYIWEDSVQVTEPDRILGIGVIESEFAPNTFTTGQYVGLVGDMFFYWIVDAANMQLARAQELYIETNQDLFLVRKETDGTPVMSEAFVRVKLA